MSDMYEYVSRIRFPLNRFSEMTDKDFEKAYVNIKSYCEDDQKLIIMDKLRRERIERSKIPYEERLRQRKERRRSNHWDED